MTYPKDLDEYTDDELLEELEERHRLRQRGLCDYCLRKTNTPACKYPERHRGSVLARLLNGEELGEIWEDKDGTEVDRG